jgi:hypothetical protein
MTKQLTTITEVRQLLVSVYNDYAVGMKAQGIDEQPCLRVSRFIANMTDETSYKNVGFLEEKVLKTVRCFGVKVAKWQPEIEAETAGRWKEHEYKKALMIFNLAQQAKKLVQTWLDNNEPDTCPLGTMEALVSCDGSVPPDGVTRSIHEELDQPSTGPLFDR